MSLQIVNPLEYPDWDEVLLTNENYSFFHSSSWARILYESYGYIPLYFTSIIDDKLSALIPVMEVKSILTGKRGVSLPFTDYCEPIVSDNYNFGEAIEDIIKYGENSNWKYIEWRGGGKSFKDAVPSLSFYTHTLDLNQDENQIISGLRDSTKRNIIKAQKLGVEVQINYSLDSMKRFFQLNCKTRKKHGLPPQPFSFFKKTYEHIIAKRNGFVALALSKKKVIAGSVFFHFGGKVLYKYGASDEKSLHMRPNNLIIWESIKSCAREGFKSLSFGITEMENRGLLQFKQGWGAEESMINYYRYSIKKKEFIEDKFRSKTSYSIFKKMPLPILKSIGSILYKHFA